MANVEPWHQSFKTLPSRAERFVGDMLNHVPSLGAKTSLDVLDLGCGTGTSAFRFAEVCPRARVTGLDISQASIQEAEKARRHSALKDRLCFIARDYLKTPLGPFDLIYADSCLHLISGATEPLLAKVAGELKPEGYLVFSMPCSGLFNTVLMLARRFLRLVRCRASDWLILRAAQWLHGKSVPAECLRERVHYMYIIPERFGNKRLERQLTGNFHLELRGVYPYPHVSLGQPQHKFWVFQSAKAVSVGASAA